jgi:hypothetical protein
MHLLHDLGALLISQPAAFFGDANETGVEPPALSAVLRCGIDFSPSSAHAAPRL